tara:strand:+ start:132 stop:599 length:468 start_codon:yes stop_codon:yes gene_type:complete
MTFKQHAQLDEAFINPVTIRLAIAVAGKLGKEIAKLAIPPLSIGSAVKGTVIYTIASKYDLTTIITIQKFGVGLIVDVGKWVGVEIAPKVAAAIFGRITAIGVVTLGTILLSVIAIKNPRKAKAIYKKAIKKYENVKTKLTMGDIKKIGKTLKAA